MARTSTYSLQFANPKPAKTSKVLEDHYKKINQAFNAIKDFWQKEIIALKLKNLQKDLTFPMKEASKDPNFKYLQASIQTQPKIMLDTKAITM